MAKYYHIPGNKGKNCHFNGEHRDRNGEIIDCHCDECNYLLCCLENDCKRCKRKDCYRKKVLSYLRYRKLRRFCYALADLLLMTTYAQYPEAYIDKYLN